MAAPFEWLTPFECGRAVSMASAFEWFCRF
jgi:hypothetical protein